MIGIVRDSFMCVCVSVCQRVANVCVEKEAQNWHDGSYGMMFPYQSNQVKREEKVLKLDLQAI